MQECFSDDPTRRGQSRKVMKAVRKRTNAMITLLSLLAMGLILGSCGGGGGGGSNGTVSSEAVSGVASGGSPMVGQVTVRDASTPAKQKEAVIGSDGSFALDVTGMKGPFVLEASGTVNGVNHRMYSLADGLGTANINPLSNAALACAAGVKDPEEVYRNPDSAMLDRARSNLTQAVADLLAKLKPLLLIYGADSTDPIKGPYQADHTGLDALFDDAKFSLQGGILTITNAKTGAVIFTGAVTNVMGGHFTSDASALPTPGSSLPAPTGVAATGGDRQITVSWAAVANATSYNIYWSTAPGVNPTTGTKIAGATSPFIQTGLAPGTTHYFIVTAVNSAGEGAASIEVAATTFTSTPGPTVPAAPTGVSATGGANQVTVSWSPVIGATSYNLYWSTASGVTPSTGTRIAGVTSPYVQTGLSAGTAYFYVVTAANSIGESAPSAQVTATTTTSAFDALSYYNANCSSCHGAPSTFTGGRTAADLQGAIDSNAGGMRRFNTLTPQQVAAIAALLGP